MGVLHSRQTMFQIGDNSHLFDFVHVTNVVHAHILAARKLLSPPPPFEAFAQALSPPMTGTSIVRRHVPTSITAESATRPFPPTPDPPRYANRTRFDAFSDLSPSNPPSEGVAGQVFYISNMEPMAFWTFARAVWHAYDGHVPPFRIQIPEAAGMLLGACAEWFGWLRGVKKEDCGLPRAHVQYVLSDMYLNVEKVGSCFPAASVSLHGDRTHARSSGRSVKVGL